MGKYDTDIDLLMVKEVSGHPRNDLKEVLIDPVSNPEALMWI